MSQRQVVLLYWGVCALFGAMALLITSRVYKLVAIVGVSALSVAALAILSRREPER
jgi:hypothetical protein